MRGGGSGRQGLANRSENTLIDSLVTHIAQKQNEFIATYASHGISIANGQPQATGDGDQCAIAQVLSHLVIDGFEAIQVEVADRQRLLGLITMLHLKLETVD